MRTPAVPVVHPVAVAAPIAVARLVAEAARAAEEAAPPAAPVAAANATQTDGTQTVVVQDGDTLGVLAPQFGVGICDIAIASGLEDPNVLTVGDTLTIPPPTATPDNASCLAPPAPAATAACVPGGPDRLVIPNAGLKANLAASFLNITLDSFVAANAAAFAGDAEGNAEALGATTLTGLSIVSIPVCPNSQCTISQGTIEAGDIFDDIARAAGSTTGQILALNPDIDRLKLQIGQTFTLPSDCRNLTADAAA